MITLEQHRAVLAAVDAYLASQQKVGDKFIGAAYAHGRDAIAELAGADVVERTLEAARIAGLIDNNFQLIISVANKWVADIQNIVGDGYLQGESPVDIAKHVSAFFGRMPGNWKVIARDQVAKAQVEGRNATYEQLDQEFVEITCAPDACDECTPFDGDIVAVTDLAHRPQFHIQCVPNNTLVLPGGRLKAVVERPFKGDVVVITTASGVELTITPNHPILTPGGWVPAALLGVGDDVISCVLADGVAGRSVDEKHVPSRIEDVAKAFDSSGSTLSIPLPTSTFDFHGDGVDGEVAIVRANRLLLDDRQTFGLEHGKQIALVATDVMLHRSSLASQSSTGELVGATAAAPDSQVHASNVTSTLLVSEVSLPDSLSLGERTHNSLFAEATVDNVIGTADFISHGLDAFPSQVSPDKVVNIQVVPFEGHVYNLHTEGGFYWANGIIVHNCACMDIPTLDVAKVAKRRGYNPDQPRDNNGRWGDGSAGPDATPLADEELTKPDKDLLHSVPFDPDDLDAWLEKNGQKGEDLHSFAGHWTDDEVDSSKIGEEAEAGSTVRGRYLATALDNAPVQTKPMHRGANFPKKLKEGDKVRLAPSSFSRSKDIAIGYADNYADSPTLFTLSTAAEAKGLPIGALSNYDSNEQEVISGGTFRVGWANQEDGYMHYYLRRVS